MREAIISQPCVSLDPPERALRGFPAYSVGPGQSGLPWPALEGGFLSLSSEEFGAGAGGPSVGLIPPRISEFTSLADCKPAPTPNSTSAPHP